MSPSPGIESPCAGAICTGNEDISYFLKAAGTNWLEYEQDTCMDGEHCSADDVFQNIHTGELTQDPSGGSAAIDLNYLDLTRAVCRPLSVPTAAQPYGPTGPGLLSFYGSFALSTGTYNNAITKVYLERCGTHLHRLVTTASSPFPEDAVLPGANSHEVVWIARPRPLLSALTIPGLRSFTIRFPRRLITTACSSQPVDYRNCVGQIALTNHRLYLLQATATYPEPVWAAPNPLPARRRTGRR